MPSPYTAIAINNERTNEKIMANSETSKFFIPDLRFELLAKRSHLKIKALLLLFLANKLSRTCRRFSLAWSTF